eukprot:TRINITY_DN112522_c0_g1_i1.p1 TRINITY_DN112522_c0_g1~~TRINITY_DN112522_c0_g1_i1.p1  ORF type:complete len:206 (+),score=22.14 TRINITY_DN112522_c0_g1_i1:73-618(+)
MQVPPPQEPAQTQAFWSSYFAEWKQEKQTATSVALSTCPDLHTGTISPQISLHLVTGRSGIAVMNWLKEKGFDDEDAFAMSDEVARSQDGQTKSVAVSFKFKNPKGTFDPSQEKISTWPALKDELIEPLCTWANSGSSVFSARVTCQMLERLTAYRHKDKIANTWVDAMMKTHEPLDAEAL